jgi:hypothetical protein
MCFDWTFHVSDIISSVALLISAYVLLLQWRSNKQSQTETRQQIEALRLAALVQAYSSERDFYEKIVEETLDKDVKAEAGERMKNAIIRMNDLVRHIEALDAKP